MGEAQSLISFDRHEHKALDENITKEILSKKGELLSECMLGNSVCTVIGVASGTALGIRQKSLRPFVKLVTVGTLADLFYGYTGNCRALIDDFNHAKRSYESTTEQPK